MINRKILSLMLGCSNSSRLPLLATLGNRFKFSKQSELEKITKSGKDLDDIIPEIKKPRDPEAGVHSVDRVIEREVVSEELKDRM